MTNGLAGGPVIDILEVAHPDLTLESNVVQLFEASAERFPTAPAVHFRDTTLTYSELNSRANQLARLLRSQGIEKEQIVALVLDRSVEMMIAILAVLKARGAYLPIPPQSPDARISFLLRDSGSSVVLTQSRYLARECLHECTPLIDVEDESLYQGDDSCLHLAIEPHDLVYVIYTSGSTGKPKGVMIEHGSLSNRLVWMQRRYPLDPGDVILQKTCYSFDVSVWELLWWSFVGGQVCFLDQGHELFPQAILEAIEKRRVTTMHFVPSMLDSFLHYVSQSGEATRLSSVKRVFCSGEELTPNHVNTFNRVVHRRTGTCLTNLYGPTEATIDVTYYDCPTEQVEVVPIGRAIDNTDLYVMRDGARLDPGNEGELHISGMSVARGYLNRTALTREKFVPDPFAPGNRMYKTGDLVRELPDGQIQFFGRIDSQIKINGKRIELGEIESCIREFGEIEKCAVVGHNISEANSVLVAFISTSAPLNVGALLVHLRAQLPAYMVPGRFVETSQLPLLSSGKIDRKRLLESLERDPERPMATGGVSEMSRDRHSVNLG